MQARTNGAGKQYESAEGHYKDIASACIAYLTKRGPADSDVTAKQLIEHWTQLTNQILAQTKDLGRLKAITKTA